MSSYEGGGGDNDGSSGSGSLMVAESMFRAPSPLSTSMVSLSRHVSIAWQPIHTSKKKVMVQKAQVENAAEDHQLQEWEKTQYRKYMKFLPQWPGTSRPARGQSRTASRTYRLTRWPSMFTSLSPPRAANVSYYANNCGRRRIFRDAIVKMFYYGGRKTLQLVNQSQNTLYCTGYR